MAAGRAGGAAPAIFNAANEQAVALFLEGLMTFSGIADAIASALESLAGLPAGDRQALMAADAAARAHVRQRTGGAVTAGAFPAAAIQDGGGTGC
jgi:1-deoxy-D-xylulose-5-phosphate reductoisomerase